MFAKRSYKREEGVVVVALSGRKVLLMLWGFVTGVTGEWCGDMGLFGYKIFIVELAMFRTRGPALLRGVNYASGAAGIRDETGTNLGNHTSMNQQVVNFASTVQDMRRLFRGDNNALNSHLSKCIFYSGMGSNDYLNNYFMPDFYTSSSDFTVQAFAAALLQDYLRQLTLVKLVAYPINSRDIMVIAAAAMKKSIRQSLFSTQGSENLLIVSMEASCLEQRFEVVDKGCCGVGRNNGQITCLPLQQACEDRRKYLFWDAFHPTEVANIYFAKNSYSS
uniref:GDSL esterase/lipase n=1 Tax=Fagus sylvatica TaxID=28930 RepID=A0A2N9FB93_FAGSY